MSAMQWNKFNMHTIWFIEGKKKSSCNIWGYTHYEFSKIEDTKIQIYKALWISSSMNANKVRYINTIVKNLEKRKY